MIQAHKLAGFIAAHGIWCVSEGDAIIPIYAYTDENDEQVMNRLAMERLEDAVAIGKERLEKNNEDANDAVLMFDGRVLIGEKKYDALIVEMRAYFSPGSIAAMAVPYSPTTENSTFKVHEPKFVLWENCDDFDLNACADAFFQGVNSHEKAAQVWNKSRVN